MEKRMGCEGMVAATAGPNHKSHPAILREYSTSKLRQSCSYRALNITQAGPVVYFSHNHITVKSSLNVKQ